MVDDASSPAGISAMKMFSKHFTAFRDEDLVEEGIPEVQGRGFPLTFPGDLVLIYREGQGGEAGEGVKEEVARAYDRVASTAEIQGAYTESVFHAQTHIRRPGIGSSGDGETWLLSRAGYTSFCLRHLVDSSDFEQTPDLSCWQRWC